MRRIALLTTVTFLLSGPSLLGCRDDLAGQGVEAAANPGTKAARGLQTRDLDDFGKDQTEAIRIHDLVYQTWGTANAQMVVTPAGNVVIDTGLPNQPKVQELLLAVNDQPITHVILTHAHADHYGATSSFVQPGTEVIAQREFLHNQRYLRALAPTFMRRNRIFFPENIPPIPDFVPDAVVRSLQPEIHPTRLVDHEYAFEVGGIRFEVLSMPGAEGSDGLCVWLPEQRILFTGDFFGHIFPMWPNLDTIRGERIRFPWPYVESLERVLELDPVLIVPSHFKPITDRGQIRAGVQKTRDAVAFVEQAVLDGINDGKDVYTLMREIRLPTELQIPEIHGKVSWGVRSIYEAYTGWFHLRSTTELYPVPRDALDPELVEMAGGVQAITERAAEHLARGEAVEALHLTDMALNTAPTDADALGVRLGALQTLLEESADVNHYEAYWLRDQIGQTQARLPARRSDEE